MDIGNERSAEKWQARLNALDATALVEASAFLKILSPGQEKILRLSFGWGCERRRSAKAIAGEMEVSTKRIYEARQKALEQLAEIGIDRTIIKQLANMQRGYRDSALYVCPSDRRELLVSAYGVERLIDEAKTSRDQLMSLSARQFEEFIAEIWNRFGYEVELTAKTRDGGRDIVAIRRAESEVKYIIECKRYSEIHKVGVDIVRSLYGVKTHDRATKAFVATTSSFTRDALLFCAPHRWELELRDYQGVKNWAEQARKARR